jgi:hypothetical protein
MGGEENLRLAFLTINNAVELIMKTFITLPVRTTGVKFTRKEVDEYTASFPALINLLEDKVHMRLQNISLENVEWYHRLRNQLYHQGNGLTIEIS